MFNLVLSVVIAISGVWVYLDATKNEIGKIEGEKGFFNLSAGAWSIVTLLLWIVGFPAYLIKRKSLIEKAYDNPVEVSGKWLKVAVLAIIGILMIAGPLAQLPIPQSEQSNSVRQDGVVSCTDEDVKKLVMEVTYEKLFEQLLPSHIQENHSVLLADLEDKDIFEKYREKVTLKIVESNNNVLFQEFLAAGGLTTDVPADYFMEFTKVSPVAAKIFEEITEQIKEYNFTLVGIRILSNEPEIKKVSCAADLNSSLVGKEYPITYTGQLTEDEQVYVEVSGL